jgi:VanZ family protein
MPSMSGKKHSNSIVIRWGPAIILMVIIFALSSVPSEEMPHFGEKDFFIKKLGHMTGYSALALAFAWGFGLQRPGALWKAWLLAAAYAVTDEFHQAFTPGRNASLLDVGIDALGAFVGLVSLGVWRRLRSSAGNNGPGEAYSPNSKSNSDFQSHS